MEKAARSCGGGKTEDFFYLNNNLKIMFLEYKQADRELVAQPVAVRAKPPSFPPPAAALMAPGHSKVKSEKIQKNLPKPSPE